MFGLSCVILIYLFLLLEVCNYVNYQNCFEKNNFINRKKKKSRKTLETIFLT